MDLEARGENDLTVHLSDLTAFLSLALAPDFKEKTIPQGLNVSLGSCFIMTAFSPVCSSNCIILTSDGLQKNDQGGKKGELHLQGPKVVLT